MRLVKSPISYDIYFQNFLINNKKSFIQRTSNSERKVIWNKKKKYGCLYRKRLTGEELKKLWIFPNIKRNVRKFIESHPDYEIEPYCQTVQINRNNIDELKRGQKVLATDLNHCYWRVAYLEGYISEVLYTKLLHPDYKQTRNKAMACMKSMVKIEEYTRGTLVKTYYEGDADLSNIYQNIRYKSYRMMDEVRKIIPKGFLKYKVDCIYYKKEYRKIVEENFKNKGLLFKTSECMYIGDNHIIDGEDVKKL